MVSKSTYLSGLLDRVTKTERATITENEHQLIVFPKMWIKEFKSKFVKFQFVNQDEKIDLFNRLSSELLIKQSEKKDADDIILNKTRSKYFRIPKDITKKFHYPSKFVMEIVKGIDQKDTYLVLKLSNQEKQKVISKIPERLKQKLKENKYEKQREIF